MIVSLTFIQSSLLVVSVLGMDRCFGDEMWRMRCILRLRRRRGGIMRRVIYDDPAEIIPYLIMSHVTLRKESYDVQKRCKAGHLKY